MSEHARGEPGLVAERLKAAMNAHDVDAFVGCFADDYDSEQPAHPDRAFRGRDQVCANWSSVFEGVPDFEAELLAATRSGEVEWSEWLARETGGREPARHGRGHRRGHPRRPRLQWARPYVEPVEQGAPGSTPQCAKCRARPDMTKGDCRDHDLDRGIDRRPGRRPGQGPRGGRRAPSLLGVRGPWTYDDEPRGEPTGEDAAWLNDVNSWVGAVVGGRWT